MLAGLGVVFTFLLLAAAAGFGYGMWEEVDVAPMKYAEQTSEKDAAALELWSVETGKWIAAVQGYEAKPPPGELAMAERPDPPSQPKPELRDTSRPRQTPVEPDPKPRNPGGTDVKPTLTPKPRTDPVVIRRPITPKRRTNPRTIPIASGPLKKARAERAIALKYYKKAAPTAPSRGRIPAAKLTLKHLKRAQGLYDIALKGKLSKVNRQRANAELTEIQRLMFWCHKFLPAGS